MKAKLLRPLEGRDPKHLDPGSKVEFPEGKSAEKQVRGSHTKYIYPAGTTIEHLHAFRLVQQGVAIPADEECRLAANRNAKQMEEAQYAYERLSRGIHPDDYDKYDRGEILGVNPDGSYIPGPHAHTLDDDDDDDDSE